jgi:hypothetical protein
LLYQLSYAGLKKQKDPTWTIAVIKSGATGQNRTADTGIFSPLLYLLSYRGTSLRKIFT